MLNHHNEKRSIFVFEVSNVEVDKIGGYIKIENYIPIIKLDAWSTNVKLKVFIFLLPYIT